MRTVRHTPRAFALDVRHDRLHPLDGVGELAGALHGGGPTAIRACDQRDGMPLPSNTLMETQTRSRPCFFVRAARQYRGGSDMIDFVDMEPW
jgi:hypothetical protein